MISPEIRKEINDQMQIEFQSAWFYLALAGWFKEKSLDGFAHWMKRQWQEEQQHGMKFYDHLLRRGSEVDIPALDKPQIEGETVLELFEAVLEHEQYVTKRIHALYDLAEKEDDYPLETLLEWFVNEQVEEEDNVSTIIDKLKMTGGEGTGLYLLDRELAKRD